MSRTERKPVSGVSNQVPHKPGYTATEDGKRLEIFGFRKWRDCTIFVASTKELISAFCIFGFAYTKSQFSHDAAHIIVMLLFQVLLVESQVVLVGTPLQDKLASMQTLTKWTSSSIPCL